MNAKEFDEFIKLMKEQIESTKETNRLLKEQIESTKETNRLLKEQQRFWSKVVNDEFLKELVENDERIKNDPNLRSG